MTFIVRSEEDPNIWVQVLKDSISPEGDRLFTIHAHYPRIVHAEIMTHAILPKNATSSRAVPVTNFLETIENNPFIPTFIGKNQSGMVAGEDISDTERKQVVKLIKNHLKSTIKFVRKLSDKDGLNIHKQIPNRYTEAFQYMNTIISGTEWHGQIGNFFKLRNHPDAEPHFQELAKCIQQAYDTHKPELLHPGEWHLPFINTQRDDNGTLKYCIADESTLTVQEVSLEDAKKISASCAAQISYRKGDTSLEKANFVWDKLIHNKPEHCYIEGTEVLTSEGFKDFRNITYDDFIADIDKDTLKFIGWTKPSCIVERSIKQGEKIYYYDNISLGVTENHNMIGSLVRKNVDRQIYTNTVFKPIDPGFNKGKYKTLGEVEALLPTSCEYDILNLKNVKRGQLIGFYIGDGYTKSGFTQFRLVKDRKIEYLTNILKELDIKYEIKEDGKTSSGNQIYQIKFKTDYDFDFKCGDCSLDKSIPEEAYKDLDILFGIADGLKNSDGSIKRNTWSYSTISDKLKNQILTLFPLVGYNVKENKKQGSGFRLMIQTRTFLKINSRDNRKPENKVDIIDNYDKKVYCVTVTGGGLIVRTPASHVLISGNSSPLQHQGTPVDYEVLQDRDKKPFDIIGITHMDRRYNLWSAQFKGWIMFRKEWEHQQEIIKRDEMT